MKFKTWREETLHQRKILHWLERIANAIDKDIEIKRAKKRLTKHEFRKMINLMKEEQTNSKEV